MIVVDTSFIYAMLDAADDNHLPAAGWYETLNDDLATTPLVLAEVDHLARTRGGGQSVSAFHADVKAGAYWVDWWPECSAQTVKLAGQYLDLGLGLTDASLVALAGRLDTTQLATFDERHFRAVAPLSGGPAFRLLPHDA